MFKILLHSKLEQHLKPQNLMKMGIFWFGNILIQPGLFIYQHNSWGKGDSQLTAGGEDGNLDPGSQRKALFGAGRTPRAAEGFRKARKPVAQRGMVSGGPWCPHCLPDKRVCKAWSQRPPWAFHLGVGPAKVQPGSGAACTIEPGTRQKSDPIWQVEEARSMTL